MYIYIPTHIYMCVHIYKIYVYIYITIYSHGLTPSTCLAEHRGQRQAVLCAEQRD